MEFGLTTRRIIGAAIRVHNQLGPGLLESAYQACLTYEMAKQGLRFRPQFPVPVIYEGVHLDCGYQADFVVENEVIVEIKAVEKLDRIFEAQLLSYMRLSGIHTGLLINFHELRLREGIRRMTLKL